MSRRNWRIEIPAIYQEDFYAVILTIPKQDGARYYARLKAAAPDRVPNLDLATHEQLSDAHIRVVLIEIVMKEQRCDLVEQWADYKDSFWFVALAMHFTTALLPIVPGLLERNELSTKSACALMEVRALRPFVSPLLGSKPYRYLFLTSRSRLRFLETIYSFDDPRILWEYLRGRFCSAAAVTWIMTRHTPRLDYAPGIAPTIADVAEVSGMSWVVDPTLHATLLAAATGHPYEPLIQVILSGVRLDRVDIPRKANAELETFFRDYGQVTFANHIAKRLRPHDDPPADDAPLEWLIAHFKKPEDPEAAHLIERRIASGDRRECTIAFVMGHTKAAQKRLRELQ